MKLIIPKVPNNELLHKAKVYEERRVMLKYTESVQYFGHLMRRAGSFEKTLMLGKIEGKRRKGWQRVRWLDTNHNSMNTNLSKLQETVKNRGAWCAAVHGVTRVRYDLATEQQQQNTYFRDSIFL